MLYIVLSNGSEGIKSSIYFYSTLDQIPMLIGDFNIQKLKTKIEVRNLTKIFGKNPRKLFLLLKTDSQNVKFLRKPVRTLDSTTLIYF